MKKILIVLLTLTLLLAGCNTPDTTPVSADMAAVYASMESTLPEMVMMNEGLMLNVCGIKSEHYVQAVVAVSDDGLRADEVWLIEAKDAATLETLKTLANSRLEQKAAESETYSPEQFAIVKKAKVLTNGNYLAVIVSPDVDTLATFFTDAFKKA